MTESNIKINETEVRKTIKENIEKLQIVKEMNPAIMFEICEVNPY